MSEIDAAETLSRRRWIVLLAGGILMIGLQGAFMNDGPPSAPMVVLWLAAVAGLLLILVTGAGLSTSRAVRALANDEGTRIHRARATAIAFWNMMAMGVTLYTIAFFKDFSGQQAVHAMMTIGLASALIGFAGQERGAQQ